MGVNSPDKKMEKQERAEYTGSGMSGCLMPLPWEGEGQQQRTVLLHGYGGGGGQRLSQKDQGWKSLLCRCSHAHWRGQPGWEPQGYRRSGSTSVMTGEIHFPLFVDYLKCRKLNKELLFVMITSGSEKEVCCQFCQW